VQGSGFEPDSPAARNAAPSDEDSRGATGSLAAGRFFPRLSFIACAGFGRRRASEEGEEDERRAHGNGSGPLPWKSF
jgi:fermentation-respiration switch protein FrsA (DUF1100 family)